MKVLFDISVLGTGHYYPHSRTGIHRVVEHLAAGLAGSVECEVAFSSLAEGSLVPVYGAREYLRRDPVLKAIPLVSMDPGDRWLTRGIRYFHAVRKRSEASKEHPLLRLPAKVTRYLSFRSESFLINKPNRSRPGDWGGVDVFHSPYDPLPTREKGYRGPQRVLTVYDLIAIFHPELFEPHIPPLMRKLVASITPDDWVTCISNSTKNDLCDHTGIDPNRVFVTHLAASPELFHPVRDDDLQSSVRRKYGIPDAPYFLSLNTLEPRKNLDRAIRSFSQLIQEQRVSDLNFVLVGSKGWDYDHIFAEASKCPELKKRVIFAGRVADKDLAPIYSGATAFVYPSLYEGFGLPILEAMQCGVPVITSDRSSSPEVVGDGGLMIDPADGEALSHAMLQLYENRELRVELSRRALGRAGQFSWDRCVSETVATYRTAIGAGTGLSS